MDTILKSWHAKGLKTAAQVDAEENLKKTPVQTKPATREELDSVRRLREINRKRRGDGSDV